jgi:hypothetical protein
LFRHFVAHSKFMNWIFSFIHFPFHRQDILFDFFAHEVHDICLHLFFYSLTFLTSSEFPHHKLFGSAADGGRAVGGVFIIITYMFLKGD